jgi:hypothetical protein
LKPRLVYIFFSILGELLTKCKKELPLAADDMGDKNDKKIAVDEKIAEEDESSEDHSGDSQSDGSDRDETPEQQQQHKASDKQWKIDLGDCSDEGDSPPEKKKNNFRLKGGHESGRSVQSDGQDPRKWKKKENGKKPSKFGKIDSKFINNINIDVVPT